MPGLNSITNAAIRHLLGNCSLNSGAAAIGTSSAADVKTTATINYILNGVFGARTAAEVDISATTFLAEDGSTVQTDDGVPAPVANKALADGYSCKYLMCYNGSAWAVVQGTAYVTGATAKIPECPPGYVPMVLVTVDNATGSAFTFGTTALDTSGITDTYQNLSMCPASATP